MNRCLVFLAALLCASITVSTACVAAPSDTDHITLEAERDGRIHASFRDETRDRTENN